MQPIEAVGVEVVSDTVSPPGFASSRVGAVALGHGPAHAQVCGLRRHKRLHVVHNHLIVPLLVLRGALTGTQEDVWPHAETGATFTVT